MVFQRSVFSEEYRNKSYICMKWEQIRIWTRINTKWLLVSLSSSIKPFLSPVLESDNSDITWFQINILFIVSDSS